MGRMIGRLRIARRALAGALRRSFRLAAQLSLLLSFLLSSILCGGCGGSTPPLLFFCGSAVKVPMEELVANYRRERGVEISVTYGGSGTLLSQMELAKRGDLYLAGSPDYIAIGEKKGLLEKGASRRVAFLVPAIIVPRGNPAGIRSIDDLARPGVRVGIGNPETVCLGLYGVELLEYNKILSPVLRNNVPVFAKSCEDTASLAVMRKVDAILGWDVFASWNPGEVEWIRIAPERIPRISYVAVALPVFALDRGRSLDFTEYVTGPEGMKVFERWGYLSDEAAARRHAPKASIGGDYALPEEYFAIVRRER